MKNYAHALMVIMMLGYPLAGITHHEGCEGCHGANGVSQMPTVPTIGGISAGVHADTLIMYRDGVLPCTGAPLRTAMCGSVAALGDEAIEEVANHFAALPFVPAKQKFDADKAASGEAVHKQSCEICHTNGGSDPAADASILAGQWMEYLRIVIGEYAAGEREQSPVMEGMIKQLTADQIEALLHFYASQQ